MPAKSKAQQRFMGMVHAYKKGELKGSEVSKDVKDAAKGMKKKTTKDYAKTKHKGLPNKVKKEALKTLIAKYGAKKVRETIMAVSPKSDKGYREPQNPGFEYDPEKKTDEGFGGELKGKDRDKFEKARIENAEQLGYKATGTSDTKKQKLKMAHQLKEGYTLYSTDKRGKKVKKIKTYGSKQAAAVAMGKFTMKLDTDYFPKNVDGLMYIKEAAKRDYKAEYKKFQSSTKSKKYRAELNQYNRKKGTYGNGDGKDASHKGGKIAGFEAESKNRGRREKSRLKREVSNPTSGIMMARKMSSLEMQQIILLAKAMKQMPGSPAQKKIKQQINVIRKKLGQAPVKESVSEAPFSSPTQLPYSSKEAQIQVDKDLNMMSKYLGKASQQVIKTMMNGVKSGKYDAMDLVRGIKSGNIRATHYGERDFIQQLWNKVRDKFRKYSKRGKLR